MQQNNNNNNQQIITSLALRNTLVWIAPPNKTLEEEVIKAPHIDVRVFYNDPELGGQFLSEKVISAASSSSLPNSTSNNDSNSGNSNENIDNNNMMMMMNIFCVVTDSVTLIQDHFLEHCDLYESFDISWIMLKTEQNAKSLNKLLNTDSSIEGKFYRLEDCRNYGPEARYTHVVGHVMRCFFAEQTRAGIATPMSPPPATASANANSTNSVFEGRNPSTGDNNDDSTKLNNNNNNNEQQQQQASLSSLDKNNKSKNDQEGIMTSMMTNPQPPQSLFHHLMQITYKQSSPHGTIWFGIDPVTKQRMAVRHFPPHKQSAIDIFFELQKISETNSENVVAPTYVSKDERYFIMESYEFNIEGVFQHRPCPYSFVLRILKAVVSAFKSVHELGCVFRSFGPMGMGIDNQHRVRVAVSYCAFKDRPKENLDILMKHYTSPEGLIENEFTEAGDVWALGACLTKLISGQRLFDSVVSEDLPLYLKKLRDGKKMECGLETLLESSSVTKESFHSSSSNPFVNYLIKKNRLKKQLLKNENSFSIVNREANFGGEESAIIDMMMDEEESSSSSTFMMYNTHTTTNGTTTTNSFHDDENRTEEKDIKNNNDTNERSSSDQSSARATAASSLSRHPISLSQSTNVSQSNYSQPSPSSASAKNNNKFELNEQHFSSSIINNPTGLSIPPSPAYVVAKSETVSPVISTTKRNNNNNNVTETASEEPQQIFQMPKLTVSSSNDENNQNITTTSSKESKNVLLNIPSSSFGTHHDEVQDSDQKSSLYRRKSSRSLMYINQNHHQQANTNNKPHSNQYSNTNNNIPFHFLHLIERMLSFDPGKRPTLAEIEDIFYGTAEEDQVESLNETTSVTNRSHYQLQQLKQAENSVREKRNNHTTDEKEKEKQEKIPLPLPAIELKDACFAIKPVEKGSWRFKYVEEKIAKAQLQCLDSHLRFTVESVVNIVNPVVRAIHEETKEILHREQYLAELEKKKKHHHHHHHSRSHRPSTFDHHNHRGSPGGNSSNSNNNSSSLSPLHNHNHHLDPNLNNNSSFTASTSDGLLDVPSLSQTLPRSPLNSKAPTASPTPVSSSRNVFQDSFLTSTSTNLMESKNHNSTTPQEENIQQSSEIHLPPPPPPEDIVAFYGVKKTAVGLRDSILRLGLLRSGHPLNPKDMRYHVERGTIGLNTEGVYLSKFPLKAAEFTQENHLSDGDLVEILIFEVTLGHSCEWNRGSQFRASLYQKYDSFVSPDEFYLLDDDTKHRAMACPAYVVKLRVSRFDLWNPNQRQRFFVTDQVLGSGGFAEVRLGIQLPQGRPVACKIFKNASARLGLNDESSQHEFIRMCQHEFEVMKTFSNYRNVAQVIDFKIVQGGEPILFMELLAVTLQNILDQFGCFEPLMAVTYFKQAASGLQALALSGFVHSDIKLGNMMLTTDGQLKITDFGLAWQAGTQMTGATPFYVAPELLKPNFTFDELQEYDAACGIASNGSFGSNSSWMMMSQMCSTQSFGATGGGGNSSSHNSSSAIATHAADCYSLGVALWKMLTGLPTPLELQRPKALNYEFVKLRHQFMMDNMPEIPDEYPGIQEILERCLDHNPENRPKFSDIIVFSPAMTSKTQREHQNQQVVERLRNQHRNHQQQKTSNTSNNTSPKLTTTPPTATATTGEINSNNRNTKNMMSSNHLQVDENQMGFARQESFGPHVTISGQPSSLSVNPSASDFQQHQQNQKHNQLPNNVDNVMSNNTNKPSSFSNNSRTISSSSVSSPNHMMSRVSTKQPEISLSSSSVHECTSAEFGTLHQQESQQVHSEVSMSFSSASSFPPSNKEQKQDSNKNNNTNQNATTSTFLGTGGGGVFASLPKTTSTLANFGVAHPHNIGINVKNRNIAPTVNIHDRNNNIDDDDNNDEHNHQGSNNNQQDQNTLSSSPSAAADFGQQPSSTFVSGNYSRGGFGFGDPNDVCFAGGNSSSNNSNFISSQNNNNFLRPSGTGDFSIGGGDVVFSRAISNAVFNKSSVNNSLAGESSATFTSSSSPSGGAVVGSSSSYNNFNNTNNNTSLASDPSSVYHSEHQQQRGAGQHPSSSSSENNTNQQQQQPTHGGTIAIGGVDLTY